MKYPISATIGLAVVATSCVTYSGVSKSADGELYISGGTSYFVYSTPWVRRCKVEDTKLDCVELTESPKPAAGSTGGTTAPAASGDASGSKSPEAPAQAPEPSAAPPQKK